MPYCGIYRAGEERKDKELTNYNGPEDFYRGMEEFMKALTQLKKSGLNPCEIRRDIDD